MANLTQTEKSRILDTIADDLVQTPNYVFLSKYTTWGDDDVKPDTDYSETNSNEIRTETFVGKRVTSAHVRRTFSRSDWTTGTVYDMYQSDADLTALDFFVITDSRRVYKCLNNAGGAASTVKPTLTDLTAFTTADGYVWKYMFTVPSDDMTNYATADTFPFSSDLSVEGAAVSGTIDAIRIDASGNNWSISETDTVLERVTDYVFKVSMEADPANSYYVDSGFYVADGGGAGFVSKIVNSYSNSTGNYVKVSDAAPIALDFGSVYVISPAVTITGDGTGAKAYSTVNATIGTIDSIVVLDPGQDYTWATVSITANAGASNTAVSATAMIAPRGGHGSDPKVELLSDEVMVSVKYEFADAPNTEFRVAGVWRQPYDVDGLPFTDSAFTQYLFANSNYYVGTTAPPSPGEPVTGQTSGATGKIIFANGTHVYVGSVAGTFSNGEIVVSSGETGSAITITPIDTPQIDPQSGDLSFFKHYDAVTRSNNSSERVRLRVSS